MGRSEAAEQSQVRRSELVGGRDGGTGVCSDVQRQMTAGGKLKTRILNGGSPPDQCDAMGLGGAGV